MLDDFENAMQCNETCCLLPSGRVLCFSEMNFTDNADLTDQEPWMLGLKWTFASLVMLMGVFGNLTIIIILVKNRLLLRTSVNQFILNMSIADLITACAGPIPFTIRNTHLFWVLGETWCYLEGYIQMLVMLVSVTSLATISLDRMIGIVLPFHTHLKKWQSLCIIITIWVVAATLAVPFAIYRIYTVRYWMDVTETLCKEDKNKIQVWWVVSVIGLTWLPLLVMIICYTTIFIYLECNKMKINKKEHPAMTHLKRRVVLMMFTIVIAFTVFWFPFQLLKFSTHLFINQDDQLYDESAEGYNILLTVSHYMMYTNVAINPIIYGFMHKTFLRAFRVTFSCLFTGKSRLVLTPGEGRQQYVWSIRSTSHSYPIIVPCPRQCPSGRLSQDRLMTSSALIGSSSLAATIAIEPRSRRHSIGSASSQPRSRSVPESAQPNEHHRSASVGDLPGSRSYVNESYVKDLSPRMISIVSTGALGHLITQVIEEESSSDVESERML